MSAVIKLSSPATHEFWEIPVLFEDEHLLALDKPARLLTAPDPADPARPNLMKLLHDGIAAQKPWATGRRLEYLDHPHELDFEATGVLLLAKNQPAFGALANLFSADRARLKYLALVRGERFEPEFEVDAKLAPHPLRPGVMRVDPDHGKKARTRFTLLEHFPRAGHALLRAEPFGGRPHQVRVHVGEAVLKLAGDEVYGGKPLWLSRLKKDFRLKPGREERPLISRAALHAEELQLPHPVTKEIVTITSEWPKDLKVAVKYLRQYSA